MSSLPRRRKESGKGRQDFLRRTNAAGFRWRESACPDAPHACHASPQSAYGKQARTAGRPKHPRCVAESALPRSKTRSYNLGLSPPAWITFYEILARAAAATVRLPRPFPGDWINLFLGLIVEILATFAVRFSPLCETFRSRALQSRVDPFTVRRIPARRHSSVG